MTQIVPDSYGVGVAKKDPAVPESATMPTVRRQFRN